MIALAVCSAVTAQEFRYQQPSSPIPRILDADPSPWATVSPDASWLLLMERPAMPHIAELSEPELGLAGRRINPRSNGRAGLAYTLFLKGLRLRSLKDSTERRISVP